MVLQNVQHLPGGRYRHAGVLPLLAGLEVDHQAQHLRVGGHHVDHPLHHVKQVMDLPRAGVRVLAARVEVLARPPLAIKAQDDLLARLLLGRDVVGCEVVDAVLAPPRQRRQQPLGRVVDRPLGRPQVTQQAVPREPREVALRQGARLVLFLVALDLVKGLCLFQQRLVLCLLLCRELWPWHRLAVWSWCPDGRFPRP